MPETELDLKTAIAKIGALDSEIKELKRQLNESTESMKTLKTKMDAASSAEKTDIVNELVSKYPTMAKDALMSRDLAYLYDLKKDLGEAQEKAFLNLQHAREKDAAVKPQGTVGFYNSETKKWEGGVE